MKIAEKLPGIVRRRLDPAQRYGLRLTLFVVALSIVAIPFAWVVTEIVERQNLVDLDLAVSKQLFQWKLKFRFLSTIFNYISFFGAPVWFWFLITAVCIYLLRRHRKRLVGFLLSSTIGGSIVNTAVKMAVNRPRPTFRDPAAITFQRGKSFPSGHTMSSTIAYGALLLIFLAMIPARRRKWALLAYGVLILAIGVARLGLGVHYVSDVLGGYLLGFAWLTLSTAAFEIWREERGKKPIQPADSGVEPDAAADLKPGAGKPAAVEP